jgi:threonyl-tRNA synthetase
MEGDATLPQMQRIYGTAFLPRINWTHGSSNAKRRKARPPALGRELDLFSIQEQYGQGLIFWHPKGGIIRQQMEDYLREETGAAQLQFCLHPTHRQSVSYGR